MALDQTQADRTLVQSLTLLRKTTTADVEAYWAVLKQLMKKVKADLLAAQVGDPLQGYDQEFQNTSAAHEVLRLQMSSTSDLSILAHHNRVMSWWIGVYEAEIQRLEQPSPGVSAIVGPDFIQVGTVRTDVPDFVLSRTIGANTWSGGGGRRFPGVLDRSKPIRILCTPGQYTWDRITHSELVQYAAGLVIEAEQNGTCLMGPNPVGGSQTFYPENAANLMMKGWTFLGDDKAAILMDIPAHRDWLEPQLDHFYQDCVMAGRFDATQTDVKPHQFGLNGYDVGGTGQGREFGWAWVVSDPSLPWGGGFREQYFYLHGIHLPGALIQGVKVRHCGRSFIQCPERAGEVVQPTDGRLVVKDCVVEDVCLEDGGGGSAIDIKGSVSEIEIINTRISLGCTPGLFPSLQGNITGAFSCKENGTGHSRLVRFQDCVFYVGQKYPGVGSARRTNVSVMDAEEVEILGGCAFRQFPGARTLVLYIGTQHLKRVRLSRQAELIGDCQIGGTQYKDPNLTGDGYQRMLADLPANPPPGVTVEIVD